MRAFTRVLLLVVLAVLLMGTHSAFAASSWCESDPIIRIGDRQINIITAVPRSNLGDIIDKGLLQVVIPYGSPPVSVEYLPNQLFEEDVVLVTGATAWSDNRNNIQITLLVRGTKRFPVMMRAVSADGSFVRRGFSNDTLSLVYPLR